MNEFIQFLSQYWKYIVYAIAYLVILIITIVKRKVKVVDNQLTAILTRLPDIIIEAEKRFNESGSGQSKFQFVLQVCLSMISQESDLSTEEAFDKYGEKITQAIEDILATPTKKGD